MPLSGSAPLADRERGGRAPISLIKMISRDGNALESIPQTKAVAED